MYIACTYVRMYVPSYTYTYTDSLIYVQYKINTYLQLCKQMLIFFSSLIFKTDLKSFDIYVKYMRVTQKKISKNKFKTKETKKNIKR